MSDDTVGAEYEAPEEPKYYGLYEGVVTSNNDPEGLGRIKFTIPGLVEPASGWTLPMFFGGGPKVGGWVVPREGDEVYLMFVMGDIDHPRYGGGHYGRGEIPTPVAAIEDTSQRPRIRVLETENFYVATDDRDGVEILRVTTKRGDGAGGNEELDDFIEIDSAGQGILVNANALCHIRSQGLVRIEAEGVNVNGVWVGEEA